MLRLWAWVDLRVMAINGVLCIPPKFRHSWNLTMWLFSVINQDIRWWGRVLTPLQPQLTGQDNIYKWPSILEKEGANNFLKRKEKNEQYIKI